MCLSAAAPDGISAVDDAVDQRCDLGVECRAGPIHRVVGMGCGRVVQDTDDFTFGQNIVIVQGKQQGFTDRQGRSALHCVRRKGFAGQILCVGHGE